ncbi:hypothetical protein HAX54_008327, partial [Datura stramonium]|nr:hypothetical protein [Datura stramonium]
MQKSKAYRTTQRSQGDCMRENRPCRGYACATWHQAAKEPCARGAYFSGDKTSRRKYMTCARHNLGIAAGARCPSTAG